MTDRLITLGAVLEMTALSKGTVYSLMSEGKFPRPLHISKRAVRWLESDVQAWLQDRINERDKEAVTVG